jgi:hypothetical protein
MNLLVLQPDQHNLLCLRSGDDRVWRIVTNDDLNDVLRATNLKNLMVVKVQTEPLVTLVGRPDYWPDAQIHFVAMTRAIDGF